MRITKKRLIAILFFVVATGGAAISFQNLPPHDFNFKEGECKTRCHTDFYPPLRFKKSMIEMCDECHSDDESVSHIVGVKPSMYVGEEFPLDENGMMTCNTCHNIHMERTDSNTGKRTYLLRTKLIGKPLCDKCHKGTLAPFMGGTPSHSGTLVKAHFGYYSTTDSFADQGSLRCISCHSGGLADHIPVNFAEGDLGGNHPVGIDYLRSFAKKKGGLKHPKAIAQEIKLIKGKLSCISCHNVYNLEKHKLTMSNEGSRLCSACHNT